ncbi:MAG: hypothetical protein Q8L24_02110 [bacterium]|nr:hypothetical protein [bacterium]
MGEINRSIFKAYDIRGKYPDEINEKAVAEIAAVLAGHFKRGKVVIGHDARLSSPALYKAASRSLVISNSLLEIVPIGRCTTPMFYFTARKLKAAGIMITASHMPKEFNGLKVVNAKGEVVSGTEIFKLLQS